jgi:acetylornithine deacetylase/succinyl-diaminopimelate desuccinylase-like protein
MSSPSYSSVDTKAVFDFCNTAWDNSVVPSITDFIKIPNQSPLYDAEIHTNGYQEAACALIIDWVKEQKVPGLEVRLVHDQGRTPLIFMTVEGTEAKNENTIMMYGHMDKQPPMEGWDEGLGPWTPKIIDGKLYGRGGADDGYAAWAAVTAIQALKAQNIPHSRIVVVIEGCEESGSADLEHYIDQLAAEIKHPNLVVCLDSGCGNYEQLWLTGSLRGCLAGDLKVEILREGVHSGQSSGIVADSFRIVRILLDRIEDAQTGQMKIPEAFVEIPAKHFAYAQSVADTMGPVVISQYPFVEGAQPMTADLKEALLNRTWRPTLTVTGADGLPHVSTAGNVLRTHTTVKLSVRTPPTCDCKMLTQKLKEVLEADPPYGAKVTFTAEKAGQGWAAPELHEWLEGSLTRSSEHYWGQGQTMRLAGEGGSIPFMAMLGHKFPGTQFVVTGVLGPGSNAHGPNEFLHIGMGKRITCTIASVVADHAINTAGVAPTEVPHVHNVAASIGVRDANGCCP